MIRCNATLLAIGSLLFLAQNSFGTNEEVVKAKKALEASYDSADAKGIREGTTADHVAIATHYQCFTQAEQLKSLPDLKIDSYEITELRTIPVTKDVVLLTFHADVEGTFQGRELAPHVRVVETWVKRDGRWLQASYQETPLPSAK